MITVSVVAEAATLSPMAALERAVGGGEKRLQSAASRNAYSYVGEGDGTSYYVFDREIGGYLVVSANDQYPAVLADIDEGRYDEETLSPGAKWILGEYSRVISTAESPVSSDNLVDLYGQWTAIGPLMSTKWNQSWPFNDKCPTIGGKTCVTGCVATAMAQVVKTIGFYQGKGYKVSSAYDSPVEFDYSSAMFNFGIMPDEPSINDSQEALDQVAQLMLACGLSVNMGYGVDESGAMTTDVAPALINNFGFSEEYTRYVQRNKFTAAQWESMLYREMSIGRPVIYRGSSSGGGHCFVIDGYAPAGQWHVNWGWGGMSDGYYNLSVLTPSQQGIGGNSLADGYNSNQAMTIAVAPGANPGLLFGAIGGKIYANDDGKSMSIYYTTMVEMVRDLSLGVIVTDGNGERQYGSFTFWTNQNLSASGTIRANNRTLDIESLNLAAGNYRIYPAYAITEENPLEITEMSDGQHYVELTVDADGSYTISNPEVNISAAALMVTESDNTLHSGYSVNIRTTLVNDGGTDYKGTIFADVISTEDETPIRRCKATGVTVSAGSNTEILFSVAGVDESGIPIPAGQYRLKFTDSNGIEIANCLWNAEVVKGAPKTYQETRNDISIYNAGEIARKVICGATWNHVPDVYVASEQSYGQLCVVFYKPGTNVKVKSYVVKEAPISRRNGNMSVDAFDIDVAAGLYEVAYTFQNTQVSGRQTVGVGKEVDGVLYVPIAAGEVAVVASTGSLYEGDIIIPEKVELDGTKYAVSIIDGGAFSSCTALKSVVLPESVKSVGRNAFAYCRGLESLIMKGAVVAFAARNHAMPGASEDAEVYVKSTTYDEYFPMLSKYHQVYAGIESLGSVNVSVDRTDKVVEMAIEPSHSAINPEFTICATDSSASGSRADDGEVAAVEVAGVESGVLKLKVTPLREGSAKYEVRSAQPGVPAGEILVDVRPSVTAIEGVEADDSEGVVEWYDLQGRKIVNRGNVPAGTVVIVKKGGKTNKIVAGR